MGLHTYDSQQGIIQFNGSVIDDNTLVINYMALPGAYPATIGYFIAIWQGSQSQGISTALHNH